MSVCLDGTRYKSNVLKNLLLSRAFENVTIRAKDLKGAHAPSPGPSLFGDPFP